MLLVYDECCSGTYALMAAVSGAAGKSTLRGLVALWSGIVGRNAQPYAQLATVDAAQRCVKLMEPSLPPWELRVG
jgi:hypothetical protein